MIFDFLSIFAKRTTDQRLGTVRRAFFSNPGSVPVTSDSAMQVAAFYRGVTYIATQIAKLPWAVKDRDQKEIIDGPIARLLSVAPNNEMNAFNFRVLAVSQALIEGNFFAEIERTAIGTPVALWPLHTRSVEVLRSVRGDIVYKVNQEKGEAVYLPSSDVFHVKNFHTRDGIVGQGVVAYGGEVLGISLAANQMAGGIFRNGGVPSGIIYHEGTLSDEAIARLKNTWGESNSGRKAGGTRVLENGMKYESVAVEPDTLQFLESRQFSVLEIARYLGVPPTKLFDVTAATYSNVENANLEVATDTLDSWAVNLEMEADIKLLNYRYGGRFTEIDIKEVFRGDSKSRASYYKDMMAVGAISPNEIRAKEGMEGYDGGDEYFIATNNYTPVSRMNDVIDAQIAGKNKSADQKPKQDQNPDQQALTQAAISYLKK